MQIVAVSSAYVRTCVWKTIGDVSGEEIVQYCGQYCTLWHSCIHVSDGRCFIEGYDAECSILEEAGGDFE